MYFLFTPSNRRWSNLTCAFCQSSWLNHQLEKVTEDITNILLMVQKSGEHQLEVGSLSSHFQGWIPPGKSIAVSGSLNMLVGALGSIYHLYTTYIPLIYCLLWGYMLPTSTYHLLREPETTKQPWRKLPHPKSPADLRSWSLAIDFGTLWNAYFQRAQGHLEPAVGGVGLVAWVSSKKNGLGPENKKIVDGRNPAPDDR